MNERVPLEIADSFSTQEISLRCRILMLPSAVSSACTAHTESVRNNCWPFTKSPVNNTCTQHTGKHFTIKNK